MIWSGKTAFPFSVTLHAVNPYILTSLHFGNSTHMGWGSQYRDQMESNDMAEEGVEVLEVFRG